MDKQEIEKRGNEVLGLVTDQQGLADRWTGLKFIVLEMNPPDMGAQLISLGLRKMGVVHLDDDVE